MSSKNHEPVPIRDLTINLILLAGLMALTIWAAQHHFSFGLPYNWGNNLLAMAIAVTKAVLVVMIFMNVRHGTKLIKLYAACGFVWVPLLAFVFCDYATRQWEPTSGWSQSSALPRGQYDGNGELRDQSRILK